jgi:hypothetical protein
MLVWSHRGHQRRGRRGKKLLRRQLQRVLSVFKIKPSRGRERAVRFQLQAADRDHQW